MIDPAAIFLGKAQECLAGATNEYASERYNNCANRCYYACFQAAVAALLKAGIDARGGQWSHAFVQQAFVGQLVNRRKLYPPELRDVLLRTLELRHVADYRQEQVSSTQAGRALRRSRSLLEAVSA
jgi:uncharacterized protein (UPF0332 family)